MGKYSSAPVPPIVVLGNSRSGTSVVCGLLHAAGVFVGKCKPPDEYNPRGYFENVALRRLARKNMTAWPHVHATLKAQGWRGESWLIKNGPGRAGAWRHLDPCFVLVRRDIKSIVSSQRRHPRCSADEDKIRRNEALMDATGGWNVWPARLAEGDDSAFRALFEHLGLAWSAAFFERELWRHG